MSETVTLVSSGPYLHVRLSGKLTKESYETFVPMVNQAIQEAGPLRMIVELVDFHGWTMGALWEDLKFDLHHWKDISRLAIVGESRWEQGMAVFCKPFTRAKVRYFDHAQLADAESWVAEDE